MTKNRLFYIFSVIFLACFDVCTEIKPVRAQYSYVASVYMSETQKTLKRRKNYCTEAGITTDSECDAADRAAKKGCQRKAMYEGKYRGFLKDRNVSMDTGYRLICKEQWGIDASKDPQKCLLYLRLAGAVDCKGYNVTYMETDDGKGVFYNDDGSGEQTWGTLKNCQPMPLRYAEIRTCLLCPLFRVILKTDQVMATMSFDALAESFRLTIVIVLALFIAYKTFLVVSSVVKQDVGKYLQEILIQAFKVLVAVLLLWNSDYIYNYAINPVMETGLEFGIQLVDPKADEDGQTLTDRLKSYTGNPEDQIEAGVIGEGVLSNVLGTVRLFSYKAAELPAIGSALMCVSMNAASWEGILPDVSMFIGGLICWAFGWAIALACCFYLLDCTVRFGIFCTLVPFFVACWPFKVTFKYTKNGWDMFMNTFFNFVMMGLIISFSAELISQALTGGEGGKEVIENALNSDNTKFLKKLMDLSGVKFLILMACCIFAFKLVGQVGALAAQISSTKGGNEIGSGLGKLAAQTAKKVGTTGTKVAGKLTGVSGAIQGVGDKIRAKNDAIRSRFGGGSKTNPNGSESGDAGGENS